MASEFVARSTYKTNHSSPARFIWSHIARHPLVAVGLLIGAFSNAALSVPIPYYVGQAFNAILNHDSWDIIIWAAIGIMVSQVLRAVLQLMRNVCSEMYGQRIERDVRDE